MTAIIRSALVAALIAVAAPVWACPAADAFEQGESLRFSRSVDGLTSVFTKDAQGNVSERRGDLETYYVQGLWAVDRKAPGQRIEVVFDSVPKLPSSASPGWRDVSPMTLQINGATLGRGEVITEVMSKTALYVGACRYDVLVIRDTVAVTGGPVIRSEGLYSTELGLRIGNVSMDANWQPKSGVFFDSVVEQ